MTGDADIVAGLSAEAILSEAHPVKSGAPCRNCGAIVEGRYCTMCGQLAADFHRPVWSLIVDSLTDTFALDGRMLRTLPSLIFRPGHVTRQYLNGKRARYMPPFRLFLLSSLIFFLTFFGMGDQQGWWDNLKIKINDSSAVSFETGADGSGTGGVQGQIGFGAINSSNDATAETDVLGGLIDENGLIDRAALKEQLLDGRDISDLSDEELVELDEMANRLSDAYENQGTIGNIMREWAPRFSILFAPIFAISLGLFFFWKRSIYFYDHLITALHFQSFLYLLGAAIVLLAVAGLAGQAWFWLSLPVIIGVYQYKLIRNVYDSGRIMTVLRLIGLFLLTIIVLSLLLTGFASLVAWLSGLV